MRGMVGGNAIDGAVGHRCGYRLPVRFAAQRRGELGEGSIVADRQFIQCEILRSGVAGDLEPTRLRHPNGFNAGCGRNMRDMIAATREREEAQVALDHDHLRGRRDACKPKPRRQLTLIHLAAAGERWFLRMLHDEDAEGAGVTQGAMHDARIGNGGKAVGERNCATLREQAEFREIFPGKTLGNTGIGVDFDLADLSGAPGDELDLGDVVDHRVSVRQRHHGRDAACCRGGTGAGDGFLVFLAWLAKLNA